MRVGVYGRDISWSSARAIRKILAESDVPCSVITRPAKNHDIVIVGGGDRGVRNYFHTVTEPTTPVLGVSESESSGFLAQVDLKELSDYIDRLRTGQYEVEEVPRIGVTIDKKRAHPVLNDVAVFASQSAILMEHTLRVNGSEVWHDSSDGVIVSTPIGSSAYSMSAGGPVIFQDSQVFGIISVNSLDVTRRPLVVSGDSTVEIDDISSQKSCEVILDGIDRYKVKKRLDCAKAAPAARIIRMKEGSTAISALAKKVYLAEELLSMPASAKLILKTLEYEGALTRKDLVGKTFLPDRTVRLSLSHLLEGGYIKRKVSIRDARQKIYEISGVSKTP